MRTRRGVCYYANTTNFEINKISNKRGFVNGGDNLKSPIFSPENDDRVEVIPRRKRAKYSPGNIDRVELITRRKITKISPESKKVVVLPHRERTKILPENKEKVEVIPGRKMTKISPESEKVDVISRQKRAKISPESKEKVEVISRRKRAKISPEFKNSSDYFDALPDDLVVCILCKLSSSATCPSDFLNVLSTCKRLNGLGVNSMVLSKASPKTFAIKAKKWCESAHRFLKSCSDAGNVEACYTLGMIRFYCLQNRGSGASLMAKAAINSHAQALYSLAVIQFNGSGGTKSDKDLRSGVALCARAAFLGHVDALRELGHCLQDGYGVRQNVAEGRRFLVQANARELAVALTCSLSSSNWISSNRHVAVNGVGCPLLSDFGCNVPAPEAHPANRFLTEWFSGRTGSDDEKVSPGPGLRLCSHAGCGRPETRKHEFRRCSVCGAVNYCSRACQALDWKLRHKGDCAPMPRWVEVDGDNINAVEINDNGNGNGNGMIIEGEMHMHGVGDMGTIDGDR